jgi:hypothetical protein
MYEPEKVKLVSLTAIITLAGLLIVIIGNHSLFPELLFYSIVMILIGVIIVLVGYSFLWKHTSNYIRTRLWRRKQNILARKYFEDFSDFVDRFTSLREFNNISLGITGILKGLPTAIQINIILNEFPIILQNPLNNLKQRLNNLRFYRSEINEPNLSSLAKEFENYVALHKRLYVDLFVTMAREGGPERISEETKRAYREYREDYNQFIMAYTEFAKKAKVIGIFSQSLPKAFDL